jgi:hypothetical protein
MLMNRPKALTAATLALLFLAACGSSGIGDILGGGSNTGATSELRGTVDYVDTSNRSVTLTNVSGYNTSMLSGGNGNTVRVYFDDRTPVTYNGQTYRVADLERGDEVLVQVEESGNNLVAESMTVTRNVATSGGSTYPGGTSYPSDSVVRGTVRYVDTSRRTIEVDRGNGSLVTVDYETSTPVYFNNQTYRAADLERGDEVDIRVRSTGSNRWLAEQVSVVRSVSSSNGTYGGSTSSQTATIRGTVRTVDTSRRTIELEAATWRSNFNSNTGTNNSRIIVSYDTNTMVDVAGQLNPVTGLERGDVIDVQVQNANATTPFAQRIYLVQDVRR